MLPLPTSNSGNDPEEQTAAVPSRTFRCSECAFETKVRTEFIEHRAMHGAAAVGKIRCMLCHRNIARAVFSRHLRTQVHAENVRSRSGTTNVVTVEAELAKEPAGTSSCIWNARSERPEESTGVPELRDLQCFRSSSDCAEAGRGTVHGGTTDHATCSPGARLEAPEDGDGGGFSTMPDDVQTVTCPVLLRSSTSIVSESEMHVHNNDEDGIEEDNDDDEDEDW